ncbi:hypothetical protein N7481_011517 [Penicillium waksmanii]|uniref:uncharacterized protein n=1 Tax=Penicillium waksmanii TaxID=69791 RepID=UPI002548E000|nr:uncharacterized protein N7481_011517 [Penicillium waksmanii]KAJ5974307.1 hypothetical protein N7481_011517 [Penicillium waksmanii]
MMLEELFTGHESFWHRRFHAAKHYGQRDYGRDILVKIIIADYKLRMNAQQQERIKRKIGSACTSGDSNKNLVKDLHSQLYNVRLEWNEVSYKLYEAESMLDAYPSKHNYEYLHKNPRWYMRKELITDCDVAVVAVAVVRSVLRILMREAQAIAKWNAHAALAIEALNRLELKRRRYSAE